MVALSKGNTITTASTIAPTHDVHHLSGNGTISTITPPSPSFCGFVVLIADSGSIVLDNNGNIDWSGTLTVSRSYILVYDPSDSKWHVNGSD